MFELPPYRLHGVLLFLTRTLAIAPHCSRLLCYVIYVIYSIIKYKCIILYILHYHIYIYICCLLIFLYAFVAESRIALARSCQSNGQSGSKMWTAKWKGRKLLSFRPAQSPD